MFINEILEIYSRFSLVLGVNNNDIKTIDGTRFSKHDNRMITLRDYFIQEHGTDISNIIYGGDEITLLVVTIILLVDEVEDRASFINTSLNNRFQNVTDRMFSFSEQLD